MDFEEARRRSLELLDKRYSELREIVADPGCCNEMYPPYKEALKGVLDCLGYLRRLNEVEIQLERTE